MKLPQSGHAVVLLPHVEPSGYGLGKAGWVTARFAAKEAIGKALGTGVHFTWTEIEVAGRGKPSVTLHGWTKDVAARKGVIAIDVSITHSRTTSAAVAIAILGPEAA